MVARVSRSALGFLLALSLVPAVAEPVAPGSEVPVRLELRLGERLHAPEGGRVTLTRMTGEETRSLRMTGRSQADLLLPAGSQWAVVAEVPGLWAPESQFETGATGTQTLHRVFLWPASSLLGRARVPKGRALPPQVELRMEARLIGSRHSRSVTAGCPVDADGRFECGFPATSVDLRLYAAGFVPRYWWQLAARPNEPTDLGLVELRPGASVAGWVEVEEGSLSEECIARLSHPTVPGSGVRQAERLSKVAHEARVDEDGFFQLDDVAPGLYQVEVTQPGYRPARVAEIEVWPESETLLRDPIILYRPLTVDLRIDPAVDWLSQPWRVELAPAFAFSSQADTELMFKGVADELGRVQVPDQAPGRFVLRVFDSTGNLMNHDFDLFISGGASALVEVRLDLVDLRGRLSYRGEPVAGERRRDE